MSKNTEIAARLRSFGKERFGTMAAFGRALEMRPQELYRYLSSQITPGNVLQPKLRNLGCDIEWLMTGVKRSDIATLVIKEENARYIIPTDIPKGTKDRIERLIAEVRNLNDEDIERVEAVVKAIFPKKKTVRKKQ